MSKKSNNIEEELIFTESVLESINKDDKPFEDIIIGRLQKLTDVLTYYYGQEMNDMGVKYASLEVPDHINGRFEYTVERMFDLIDIDIKETIEDKKKYYESLKQDNNGK